MPEKEVIVKCYDKSGTLLTTCSAVSFDGVVILMYGLSLAPITKTKLKQWFESVLTGVNSEIQSNHRIDEEIEFVVHEDDMLADGVTRPGYKMISAGMWTCSLVKSAINREVPIREIKSFEMDASDFALIKCLASMFIFLETPRGRSNLTGHYIKAVNIIDKLVKPSRGQNIIIEHTPFLDHNLMNSHSRGIVSKVFGPNDCMFLTDVVTTSCSVGAPIFSANSESSKINGKGSLLGVTCKVFTVNEITLGISLLPVLWRLLPPGRELRKYPNIIPPLNVRTLMDETIVSISCVNSHSSGIVIGAASGIIITCSHCIPQETTYIHVVHKGNIYPASLVYKTANKFPCDLAVIKVSSATCFVTQMGLAEIPAQIGDRVHAVGFPHFLSTDSATVHPFISSGYIAKCTPSFIVTTCFIYPGLSGGAIVRNGELLGIICANLHEGSKSSPKGKDYFRWNLAIPAAVFIDYVKKYIETENIEHLKEFESWGKNIPQFWPANSKI